MNSPIFVKPVKTRKTGRFLIQNSIFEIWQKNQKPSIFWKTERFFVYRSVFNQFFVQNSIFEWKTVNRLVFQFIVWFSRFIARFFKKNQKLIFLSLTNRFLVNRRNQIRPVLSDFCKNRPVYVDIIIHGLESTCINKFSVIASVGIS
jgi:hypothetical protein